MNKQQMLCELLLVAIGDPTNMAIVDLGAMGIDFAQLCLTRPALHVMLRLTTTLLVWKQLFGMVESRGTEG